MNHRLLGSITGFLMVLASLDAAVLTVVNTSDAGAGSLRQAILDSNASPGVLDTIAFGVTGAGCSGSPAVCTIQPMSTLPPINDPVVIDGYTQPGASANVDPDGDDALILIELDGSALPGATTPLLDIHAGGTTVRGLAINRAPGPGIQIVLAGGDRIEGNFIGTDAAGSAALANGEGVLVVADDNTVGGPAPSARNVISGNVFNGVDIRQGQNGNRVLGNFIGADRTGTLALGNHVNGIFVDRSSTTAVGGAAPGEGNVVSGNLLNGIRILRSGDSLADANVVRGNRLGTDAAGTGPLGNGLDGLSLEGSTNSLVGGTAAGEGNVIAFNGKRGVLVTVQTASGNAIRGNAIFGNAELGIDIVGANGPDTNDAGDADAGPNNLQNFPLVTSVLYQGAHTTIGIVFDGAAGTTFDIDFYANPICASRPHDFQEGQTYIGSGQFVTDGAGHAAFDAILTVTLQPGQPVTATATDPGGNTSEFSPRLPFSISPVSGPAAGGTGVTIAGTSFAAGAVVTIGGVAATNVSIPDSTQITATTPALSPGVAYDVTVTNTDETNGTLSKGFVTDFLDVAPSHPFYNFVTTLVSNAITAGIGGGLYGVDQPTLRQQMAVFILKAKHGLCYAPPSCAGVFPDVPCPSTFADWIEAMAAEGITGGCGGGNFCPTNPVRRDQMAVFLLKGEHGSSYVPPACTGVFDDVQCPSQFADWIEQLAAENITGGCGNNNYCPLNPNTRGQMAVFITKTFNLQ